MLNKRLACCVLDFRAGYSLALWFASDAGAWAAYAMASLVSKKALLSSLNWWISIRLRQLELDHKLLSGAAGCGYTPAVSGDAEGADIYSNPVQGGFVQ